MLFRKNKAKIKTYDCENLRPIVRCSICTGEEVAGFKNIHDGHFTAVKLIKTSKDLDDFMKEYGIDSITKEC